MKLLIAAMLRDLKAHVRRPGDVLNPLVFFIIVISLFPLGIGPGQATLQLIAPGVIWVAALLATMMAMENMFRSDFEDGSLEQMALSPQSMPLLVLGKIVAHWLVSGLPLVLLTPVVSLTYYLSGEAILVMTLSVLLATPSLSMIGSVGAALTLGLPRGGLLIAILVLPLYVPVLIFATSMVLSGTEGTDYTGQMYWLMAILLMALALVPLTTTASLRVSLGR